MSTELLDSSAAGLAVILLAGGTAKRLGGVSKPGLQVGSRRMVDYSLELLQQRFPGARLVVVAPDSLDLPAGVPSTLEDPPFGGPAAGVSAGFEFFKAGEQLPSWVAVLPVDAPYGVLALEDLVAATRQAADDASSEAAFSEEDFLEGAFSEGAWPAWQAVVGEQHYPTIMLMPWQSMAELFKAGPVRDISLRRLWSDLEVTAVPVSAADAFDIDTPEDLAHFLAHIKRA
ncbi:hypothetical protein BSR29_01325 [Boudabousia liubingyangii]|uniref:MobA-like NTP transferase domain-containing protein n=1 Tax=Boudabousia liubingyangii TaxID=1921764 RepID=A0A1Q5PQ16_9ACTO|nr:NTP transferase domain-containing protein [Boudabousia liubingyangii]OKL49627.1 hypothetical protein BSR29_01325 [Boudabousia liubingyangii]